jgi:NAD(P)H-dependent FMN reductase
VRGSILFLAGGVRPGSANQQLVDAAANAVENRGIGATRLSLNDHVLPLFGTTDAHVDDVPEAAALKQAFQTHSAIIIASPEHNGSVTAMLKNAIDWMSCPGRDEKSAAYSAFRGKVFGLMSASASPFGGMRGLFQLRHILTTVQALVVPEQLSIPHAHKAFDEDGKLADAMLNGIMEEMLTAVIHVAERQQRDAA